MTERLRNKVALITGTGSGLGREAACAFSGAGARVIGADADLAAAEETAGLVTASGGEMVSVAPVDLTREDGVARLLEEAEAAYGGIDILYNNGYALRTGGYDMSRDDFEFTMRNEVTIVWLMTKAAVPAFRRRGGGAVVNLASIAGTTGTGFVGNGPGMFAHSVAKAAVIRMSKVLAIELAPDHVRVNALLPGIIESASTRHLLGGEASPTRTGFIDGLLIKRTGTPQDVADAAVFLASEEASYITGTTLSVDGGSEASGGAGLPPAELLEALRQFGPAIRATSGERPADPRTSHPK